MILTGRLGVALATAGLAGQIVEVLFDKQNPASERETLAVELRSFQSTMILTDKALRRCAFTPFAGALARSIRPDVARCHLSLAQFLDKINAFGRALSSTKISSLRQTVMRTVSDDALALTAKLSNHRLNIAILLVSLNSARSPHVLNMRLNDIQAHLHTTISSFYSLLHIKENTIDVVDHLGDTIPVSTLFCSSWQSFNYVVKGYCRNRLGQSYIERGDYQIVRPDNDQVIHPTEFSRMVEEGETVEMSIIVRPPVEHDERRCPQCRRLNPRAASYGGWIRCITTGCDRRFRCIRQVQGPKRFWKRTESGRGHYPRRLEDTKFFRRITLQVEFDEYDLEVKLYMHKMERLTMPSFKQLDQNSRFNADVRMDLMDFMISVHESLNLRPETLYLAVNIMDRYLSLCDMPGPLKKYRMLAGTAMWIAAKKEDLFVPLLRDIIDLCEQEYETESDFKWVESDILHTIQWMLEHPTAFLWFSMSTHDLWDATEVKHVGWFLMELTLYNCEFIHYKSSSIASGSLIVARTLLDPAYQRQGARQEPLEVATALEKYLGEHFNDLPKRLVRKYSYLSHSNASKLVMQHYSQASQSSMD